MLRNSIIFTAAGIVVGLAINVCAIKFDVRTHRNWPKELETECGISDDSDRIIGGTAARLGQYPWQAKLGYLRELVWDRKLIMRVQEFSCGGSLINTHYVITAAHCLQPQPLLILNTVHLGDLDTTKEVDCDENVCADRVQVFYPSKIVYPRMYSKPIRYKNDLGMIKLDRAATITDWVRPICLPYGNLLNKTHVGETAEVSGWGLTDSNTGNISTTLQTVQIPIEPMSKCLKNLPNFKMDRRQICAGGVEGKDSCGGDSGGPLQRVENSEHGPRYFLIGVVSFGNSDCGLAEFPAIYTRVGAYMKWILDNLSADD